MNTERPIKRCLPAQLTSLLFVKWFQKGIFSINHLESLRGPPWCSAHLWMYHGWFILRYSWLDFIYWNSVCFDKLFCWYRKYSVMGSTHKQHTTPCDELTMDECRSTVYPVPLTPGDDFAERLSLIKKFLINFFCVVMLDRRRGRQVRMLINIVYCTNPAYSAILLVSQHNLCQCVIIRQKWSEVERFSM